MLMMINGNDVGGVDGDVDSNEDDLRCI